MSNDLDRRAALVSEMAGHLHAGQLIDAGRAVARFAGADERSAENQEVSQQLVSSIFYWSLNNDRYDWAARIAWGDDLFTVEPESVQRIWSAIKEDSAVMFMGAASMGKCLEPSTYVRLSDGGLRRADEVRVGDELAGDDGSTRRVLQTCRGEDEMFEVQPSGAPAFRCNSEHILSLVCTWTKRNNGGRYGISSGYTPGRVVDVPVREYFNWSNSKKRAYLLFSRRAAMPAQPVKVDPYIYGAWLGDGTWLRAELTTPEGPMSARWCEYWTGLGFQIRTVWKGGCGSWFVHDGSGRAIWPNAWFKESAPSGHKFIRPEYLTNSEGVRFAVLAGWLDADAEKTEAGGYCGFARDDSLKEGIVELAASLGLRVTAKRVKKKCQNGFVGEYWSIHISGDVARIPCREKPVVHTRTRGLLNGDPVHRFTVKSVGRGPYAGFALDGNHRFLLGSGIVTHNSYSAGGWLLLDWVRDPEYTNISLVGPSEDHLKDNLFTHLVSLHQQSTIPLPGIIGDLFIGMDTKSRLGAIRGIIIPLGKRPAGRLQGKKRKPRKVPHPQFGRLSRMRIFLDEFEKIPSGVWKDIDNVFSQTSKDPEGFKILGAFNPEDPHGNVAIRCEPKEGWSEFDPETNLDWRSKRGWRVVRLDAAKSENVVSGKVIYEGLQTKEGFDKITENAGGTNAPGYWTMNRACFPMSGAVFTIVSTLLLQKLRGEFIFVDPPEAVGSVDVALEGGDSAEFASGRYGKVAGFKLPISPELPAGREVFFTNAAGKRITRYGVQIDQIFPLQPGDTVAMALTIKGFAIKLGIKPGWLVLDRTGNGAGVHDLLKTLWSPEVLGVNYSNGPTEKKILEEDTVTADKTFDRIASEIWFALKKYAEFDLLKINPAMPDLEELEKQLGGRRYASGKLNKVESKPDYKSRGNTSPNKADGATLLVHATRIASGRLLSGVSETGAGGAGGSGAPVVRVDATNRYDDLD